MICSICSFNMNLAFRHKVLNKYDVAYFQCQNCGYLQTENPFWLEEAYKQSINVTDTGILSRNINFSKSTSVIIYFLFNRKGKFVDWAGGYGIFTRLMRDIGFNFYWYDPYTPNLVARGFEFDQKDRNAVELLTIFETFEHFSNPIEEIKKIIDISPNIIFSTELLPNSIPEPQSWWYYGFDHGQHISFYSLKTLTYIAKIFGLNFLTNGELHLFTKKDINPSYYYCLNKIPNIILSTIITNKMKSKTYDDLKYMNNIITGH